MFSTSADFMSFIVDVLRFFKALLYSSAQKTASISNLRLKGIMFWCKCLFKYHLFSEFICRCHQASKFTEVSFSSPNWKLTILASVFYVCRQGQNAPEIFNGHCSVFLLLSQKSCVEKVMQYCLLLRQNNSLQLPLVPKEVTKNTSQRPCTECPTVNSSEWI